MKKIIIADDSSTARMFARKCVEIAGIRDVEWVEVAGWSGVLEALAAGPVDLLLTDLYMPGIDGIQALQQIRANAALQKMPVLVITSAKNSAREVELKAAGANAVLPKPLTPALMANALKELSLP